jgi:hypothetical protein
MAYDVGVMFPYSVCPKYIQCDKYLTIAIQIEQKHKQVITWRVYPLYHILTKIGEIREIEENAE